MEKRLTRSRMRDWRLAHGFTLEEVSDLTGLSASMLWRVENGRRNLRPQTKVTVARRLGVPLRELFEVEELETEHAAAQ